MWRAENNIRILAVAGPFRPVLEAKRQPVERIVELRAAPIQPRPFLFFL